MRNVSFISQHIPAKDEFKSIFLSIKHEYEVQMSWSLGDQCSCRSLLIWQRHKHCFTWLGGDVFSGLIVSLNGWQSHRENPSVNLVLPKRSDEMFGPSWSNMKRNVMVSGLVTLHIIWAEPSLCPIVFAWSAQWNLMWKLLWVASETSSCRTSPTDEWQRR